MARKKRTAKRNIKRGVSKGDEAILLEVDKGGQGCEKKTDQSSVPEQVDLDADEVWEAPLASNKRKKESSQVEWELVSSRLIKTAEVSSKGSKRRPKAKASAAASGIKA